MAGLDLTAFDAMMKERYPSWEVLRMVFKRNPVLALLPRDENFVGSDMVVPTIFGNPQGRSAVFATAQAGAATSTTKSAAFRMTRKKNYGVCLIENELIEASRTNEGAFLSALETEMDGMLNNMSNDYGMKIFGTGSGKRGIVKAATSPTTSVELQTADDVVNFEVGMYLNASSTDGGGSLRADAPYITAINRETGVLTVSATVAGSWVAGDYIFAKGDYDESLAGLQAWLPYDDRAAKLAASFYGVTRNVDSFRLGGLIKDTSGSNYEEGLIDALALMNREGAAPDLCVLHPTDYSILEKILGSKVQYTQLTTQVKDENGMVKASIGFNALMLHGGENDNAIPVIRDRSCPRKRGFLLQTDTWKLSSLGKLVRIFDTDGTTMLRQSTADGVEVRGISYANLACRAPGWNMQVNLA